MKKIIALLFFGFFALTVNAQETSNDSKEEKTYTSNELEVKPSYPGGINAFYNQYLVPKIKQIMTRYKGKIYMTFIVETDGSVVMSKVLYGNDTVLNDELVKILNNSPKWNPGRYDGKPVRASYNLPITFN